MSVNARVSRVENENTLVLAFIDLGGETKLVSRSEYASAEALKAVMAMGMLQGITETWDRLEEHLDEIK